MSESKLNFAQTIRWRPAMYIGDLNIRGLKTMIEIQKYLYDIQTSIDSINEYLGDKRDFNPISATELARCIPSTLWRIKNNYD